MITITHRNPAPSREEAAFVAFDLLHLDGRNLRGLPLSQRIDELTKLIGEDSARVRISIQARITSSKAKRKGKIFIDWMRNGEGSTCIAPCSLRARVGAAVSMPVDWADLATTTADGFTLHEPLTPPSKWIDPKPRLILKALLRRLTV